MIGCVFELWTQPGLFEFALNLLNRFFSDVPEMQSSSSKLLGEPECVPLFSFFDALFLLLFIACSDFSLPSSDSLIRIHPDSFLDQVSELIRRHSLS
jgi:hypothetical protein